MCTGVMPFRGETSALILNGILERAPVAPVRFESRRACRTEADRQQGAGERPRYPLPVCRRTSRRSKAAEAGHGVTADNGHYQRHERNPCDPIFDRHKPEASLVRSAICHCDRSPRRIMVLLPWSPSAVSEFQDYQDDGVRKCLPCGDIIVFTYTSRGFAIWDATGRLRCLKPGNSYYTMAISTDNHWLAAAPSNQLTDVAVWELSQIIASCSSDMGGTGSQPR